MILVRVAISAKKYVRVTEIYLNLHLEHNRTLKNIREMKRFDESDNDQNTFLKFQKLLVVVAFLQFQLDANLQGFPFLTD